MSLLQKLSVLDAVSLQSYIVNLCFSGDIDLDTVNALTYKSYDGARPAQKIDFQPQMAAHKRGKFTGETQAMRDFGYKGMYPPAKAITPPPATVDLRFDNR